MSLVVLGEDLATAAGDVVALADNDASFLNLESSLNRCVCVLLRCGCVGVGVGVWVRVCMCECIGFFCVRPQVRAAYKGFLIPCPKYLLHEFSRICVRLHALIHTHPHARNRAHTHTHAHSLRHNGWRFPILFVRGDRRVQLECAVDVMDV